MKKYTLGPHPLHTHTHKPCNLSSYKLSTFLPATLGLYILDICIGLPPPLIPFHHTQPFTHSLPPSYFHLQVLTTFPFPPTTQTLLSLPLSLSKASILPNLPQTLPSFFRLSLPTCLDHSHQSFPSHTHHLSSLRSFELTNPSVQTPAAVHSLKATSPLSFLRPNHISI